MVTIKVKGLPELNELSEQLKDVKISPKQVVSEYGVYAKNIAPKATGALQNGIRWFSTETQGTIRSGLPNHPDKRNRPYHMWMQGNTSEFNFTTIKAPNGDGGYDLSTGKYSPKSGKPNYMVLTARKLDLDIDKLIKAKLAKL